METVRFETLGCKLNQIETESLAHAFAEAGFVVFGAETLTDDEEGGTAETIAERRYRPVTVPDLCVVNTCTVTGKAEQKARRLIRNLLSKYPGAPVLVTGCYAEVETDALEAIGPRVCVFPGSRKGELADLPRWLSDFRLIHPEAPVLAALEGFRDARRPAGETKAESTFRLATDDFLFHSRASIKIQDGCNNHCTYCRIRLARGSAVSLPAADVIAQIRRIEEAGWAEVVLTGVNLSQYRSDGADFADLLRRILDETKGVAIRISSLYPERVDEAMMEPLSDPRIRPHFHLSVQSGSDRILRAMKRPYSTETVYEAVSRLRHVKANPFIACDIITGFPGETDEDFERTFTMCQELGFAGIHAFPFSARPGTEAWSMKPRIPERVAGERVRRLGELAVAARAAYENAWIGKPLRAVIERGSDAGTEKVLTENYLSSRIPATGKPAGSEVTVILTAQGEACLS